MKQLLSKATNNECFVGFLFLTPNFLGFLLFTSIPVLASLGLSFVDWDILSPPKFVGLANFSNMLGMHKAAGKLVANDPIFWQCLQNTFVLMLVIPFSIAGSLIIALAMNKKIKGIAFLRGVYFLPTVCAGVPVLLVWKWLYNPDFGLINVSFGWMFHLFHVHVTPPDWLSSTVWAKPALMLMGFWGAIGGTNMILYLAALQGVPPDLYEAAEIDGANGWHKFWAVTLPFLSPTTFFILIMSLIGGLQGGFMQAYVMTGGGPAGSTTTLDYYIYNQAYQFLHMGYAASIAWFLFVLIFGITLINWKAGGKLVHY